MSSPPGGPKYLSVREHLRRRVSALPEHTLLPPEPQLCAEYGVSRITLRRAVDGLVADGHLVREQGRGTFVTRPAIRHEYREVVFQDAASGATYKTRSTMTSDQTVEWTDGRSYPLVVVDISAASHPFWTGNQRVLDTAGRVERFRQRYGGNERPRTK